MLTEKEDIYQKHSAICSFKAVVIHRTGEETRRLLNAHHKPEVPKQSHPWQENPFLCHLYNKKPHTCFKTIKRSQCFLEMMLVDRFFRPLELNPN